MGQLFFRAFPFLKLPDLPADTRDHLEQFVVTLANLLTEKLNHADHFVAELNRKTETRAESGAFRQRRARKVTVLSQIRNPYRSASLPDPSRQPDILRKQHAHARSLEVACLDHRTLPHIDAAQYLLLMIDGPKHADLPTKTLANCFENLVCAFDEIDGARNDSRDRVLQRQPAFGAASFSDVAREAAGVNKLAVFEVSAGVDAHDPARTVLAAQARFVVAHHFTFAQPIENIFDCFAVDMKVDDVATDVFVARVAEQIEFGLVRAQDRPVGTDPMQT